MHSIAYGSILLLSCALLCQANPEAEREFHRIINSNTCLQGCMRPLQQSQMELSVFKRSNFSDYLLNLDNVCIAIDVLRECVDECGIKSNPFALQNMKVTCSVETRRDVAILTPCLRDASSTVQQKCADECGDYEAMTEQIHRLTSATRRDDKPAHEQLRAMSGEACSVLKCSARCAVVGYNVQCQRLLDGRSGGDVLQGLIERVLVAHRKDLEALGLVEVMTKATPPQCNHLYMPQALFDAEHDPVAAPAVEPKSQQEPEQRPEPVQSISTEGAERSLLMDKLKLRILQKQFDVLSKQARNLDTQNAKTSFEIAQLLHRPQYQF